jgi:hypothetical protein
MTHQVPPSNSAATAWWEPFVLQSLQGLERAVGELTGAVRTGQAATDRRIEDLRAEMVGRLELLDRTTRSGTDSGAQATAPQPPPPAAPVPDRHWSGALLEVARGLPWTHIIMLGGLLVLGLMGHLGPADIRRVIFGA